MEDRTMIDDLVNQLRLPDAVIPQTGNADNIADTGDIEEGWFIRGPISGSWISKAAHLGGHTVNVALAILYVKGFQKNRKNNMAELERFHFDRFGVKKDSARRALNRLQEAGLIKYTKDGQKYKVTIIN